MKIRLLSQSEERDLDLHMAMGLELVPFDPEQQEEGYIVVGIHLMIESLRQGQDLPSGLTINDTALCLGVVWGEELCSKGKWTWGYASMPNGFEGPVIVDAIRSRFCFPIHCIGGWLEDTESENRCMHFFVDMCRPPQAPLGPGTMRLMG